MVPLRLGAGQWPMMPGHAGIGPKPRLPPVGPPMPMQPPMMSMPVLPPHFQQLFVALFGNGRSMNSGGTGTRGPAPNPFANLGRFSGPFGNGGGSILPKGSGPIRMY